MNLFIQFQIWITSKLLLPYPSNFRKEFAEEMLVVFEDVITAAAREGILYLLFISTRERDGLVITSRGNAGMSVRVRG